MQAAASRLRIARIGKRQLSLPHIRGRSCCRSGDRDDQFRILIDLARLAILREDFALAREQAASARESAESLENREGAALAELARIAVARGA